MRASEDIKNHDDLTDAYGQLARAMELEVMDELGVEAVASELDAVEARGADKDGIAPVHRDSAVEDHDVGVCGRSSRISLPKVCE